MSEELSLLLQRIHPVVKPSEPSEPSENLLKLMTRVENRQWLEQEIAKTEWSLKEVRAELKFIKHAPNCSRCLPELQIDIERYGGGKGGLWYLDLTNEYWDEDEDWENDLPEYYKDCPKVGEYRIGSYWTGASDDTIRFIKDRLKWAEKILQKEVKVIRRYLRALRKWDLESPLPPDSYINTY